jgi:exoribonuclease R
LFYSHTTSPIRRYSDLINQRQIKALLRKDKIPYNENEIRKMIEEVKK